MGKAVRRALVLIAPVTNSVSSSKFPADDGAFGPSCTRTWCRTKNPLEAG